MERIPSDLIQLLSEIREGRLPKEPNVLKYDFTPKHYASLKWTILAGVLVAPLLTAIVLAMYWPPVFKPWSFLLCPLLGILFFFGALRYWSLERAARKGLTFLLLTSKYLVECIGRNQRSWLWTEIRDLRLAINPKTQKVSEVVFQDNGKTVTIDLFHLSDSSAEFVAKQLSTYEVAFGEQGNENRHRF